MCDIYGRDQKLFLESFNLKTKGEVTLRIRWKGNILMDLKETELEIFDCFVWLRTGFFSGCLDTIMKL
jgi:hypothetical protein